MLHPVTLEGQLVRLEPLQLSHADSLAAAASESSRESFSLTYVPDGEASAREYVARALDEQDAGKAVPLAIVARLSGAVVGSTRFFDIQYWSWMVESPFAKTDGFPDALEIGFTWLAPSAQRSGINTEAKLLMLTHAFEAWGVRRVRLATDARNARSRAAIERLGARLDGILRAAGPGYDGEVRDTASYSILESEWPAVKDRLRALLRLP